MLKERIDDDERAAASETAALARDLDDRRLLARTVGRDLAAFEALYRSYHPRLTRFLERTTRRPALVDELLNDTMFVVWNRAATYNATCKVSTWIFAIAYRKAMKALRQTDDPVPDEDVERLASEAPGPEQCLSGQQRHAMVLQALAGLSAEHRAVVDLTYFHGADYREIAQIVDCPVATVKTRMFHARRRLKALLAGLTEDGL